MNWSVSDYISYFVCILYSGEVQCTTHSTCNILCLPSTTHFAIQVNSLNVTSRVDLWVGKGVDQRTLAQLQLPYQIKEAQSNPPGGIEKCEAALLRKVSNRLQPKKNR